MSLNIEIHNYFTSNNLVHGFDVMFEPAAPTKPSIPNLYGHCSLSLSPFYFFLDGQTLWCSGASLGFSFRSHTWWCLVDHRGMPILNLGQPCAR